MTYAARWVRTGAAIFALTIPLSDVGAQPRPERGPSKKEIKKACVDAHADGQAMRKRGELRAARETFAKCGDDACPAGVRSDCVAWFGEVGAAQPSVVLRAKDATGRETTDVSVSIDGGSPVQGLDGRPIELDPGPHTLRFEAKDGAVLDKPLLIAEGERSKIIVADFTRPLADYELTVPTIVLGSVAIVGLASFIGFGVSGKNKQAALESSCAPRCDEADADAMTRDFIVADVSLVVSALSAGGALVFFFTQERGPAPPEKPVAFRLVPSGRGATLVFDF